MYAVIRTGGKQYRVSEGESLRIEKIPGDNGSKVKLEDVLLIQEDGKVKIGKPVVKGASVSGTIIEQGKARKIKAGKFKKRKSEQKRWGHRQLFTRVKIESIKTG
jgi:large subunit ribosomal protein L21